jgi:hypothetical protein
MMDEIRLLKGVVVGEIAEEDESGEVLYFTRWYISTCSFLMCMCLRVVDLLSSALVKDDEPYARWWRDWSSILNSQQYVQVPG